MKKEIKKVLDENGWDRYEDKVWVDLRKVTPLGEDFGFCVEIKNFIENVKKYADNFDPDEHAEMWIELRGKNGVPNSIRDLLQDADDIKKMLQELVTALENINEK